MACNVYKILKRELRISKRFLAAVAALVFMLFGLMNVVGFLNLGLERAKNYHKFGREEWERIERKKAFLHGGLAISSIV